MIQRHNGLVALLWGCQSVQVCTVNGRLTSTLVMKRLSGCLVLGQFSTTPDRSVPKCLKIVNIRCLIAYAVVCLSLPTLVMMPKSCPTVQEVTGAVVVGLYHQAAVVFSPGPHAVAFPARRQLVILATHGLDSSRIRDST